MMSCTVISFNWPLISSLAFMGTLCLHCSTVGQGNWLWWSICLVYYLFCQISLEEYSSDLMYCLLLYGLVMGEWSCNEWLVGLWACNGWTLVVMDVFLYCGVCVLTKYSCLHWFALLWHNTMRNHSCVLAA